MRDGLGAEEDGFRVKEIAGEDLEDFFVFFSGLRTEDVRLDCSFSVLDCCLEGLIEEEEVAEIEEEVKE